MGRTMEITYDKDCDCLYIKLSAEQIAETDQDQKSGVIIDYSSTGNIVGLEVLNASNQITDPTVITLRLL